MSYFSEILNDLKVLDIAVMDALVFVASRNSPLNREKLFDNFQLKACIGNLVRNLNMIVSLDGSISLMIPIWGLSYRSSFGQGFVPKSN